MPGKIRSPTPVHAVVLVVAGLSLLRWIPDAGQQSPSGHRDRGHVAAVIDGDTIELADGRRVRLLGIDAPELGYDGAASEAGADAARLWLQDRLLNRPVELEYGASTQDHYGRTLAWLFDEQQRMVNRDALLLGHARIVTRYGLPAMYSPQLYRAAAIARAERRGIWSQQPQL